MQAPQDILRELTYGLNAFLLAVSPEIPSGKAVAAQMRRVLSGAGARLGAPALLEAWREATEGDLDSLTRDALMLIMEELSDQEDPFTASDILRLLQREPFWLWDWDPHPAHEDLSPLAVEAISPVGSTLPIGLRPMIVGTIHAMEVELHSLHVQQRSLYDQLDEAVFTEAIASAVDQIRAAGQTARMRALPRQLADNARVALGLPAALRAVQRWKLAPGFDPAPDEDDGEWTVRVLERLYQISWSVP